MADLPEVRRLQMPTWDLVAALSSYRAIVPLYLIAATVYWRSRQAVLPAYSVSGMRRRGQAIESPHLQTMTEIQKFEAAFAALPSIPEEVRTTVLVIWLEVISGRVDLPTLRQLCRDSLAEPGGHPSDAMMLDVVDQLIMHCDSRHGLPPATKARQRRGRPRASLRFRAGVRSRRRSS